jgi:hypothetical protein
MSYGIYNNSTDFYNNLQINHRVTYKINDTESVIGTVISLTALGVKAVVIIDSNKKKYIVFPRNSDKLEIAP